MPNYILHDTNPYINKDTTITRYYSYSTQNNNVPIKTSANSIGNGVAGPSGNFANYDFGADWNGSNGNVTTVGTNGSPSFYGTYDQTGQVWEWNEAISGINRGVRGGSWLNSSFYISSSYRGFSGAGPNFGNGNVGFRIGCGINEVSDLLDFIKIKDVNNPNDISGFGSVSYAYKISKYPITNNLYCDFLNLKAKSDPYALYNTNMGSAIYGGITRTGVSGSYSYTVKPNMSNKPVVYISWYDALRFANWMHNGANNGSTETGAYSINGAFGGAFTRNTNAKFWLPSEDEWYKAAYYLYQPNLKVAHYAS